VLSALETFATAAWFFLSLVSFQYFYGLLSFPVCALLPRMVIMGESPQLKLNPHPYAAALEQTWQLGWLSFLLEVFMRAKKSIEKV